MSAGSESESSLEPAKEGGNLRLMTQNVWRPCFYLDEKGQMLPGVCNKWEVTDDGLKYTLRVDPQAKWSDGSKITAAAMHNTTDGRQTRGVSSPAILPRGTAMVLM